MFSKSNIFKSKINQIDIDFSQKLNKIKLESNANNINTNFQLSELNLDNILDLTDSVNLNINALSLGTSRQINKNATKMSNYMTNITKLTDNIPIKSTKINEIKIIINKEPKLFKSRKINQLALNHRLFNQYIPQSSVDKFVQYNTFCRKRKLIDIDQLLKKGSGEPLIKQLKPNKYQKGIDTIVPKYLQKKTKKFVTKKDELENDKHKLEIDYDFKSILKAYKAFHIENQLLTKVCFVGPYKSGKSTLLGSILMNRNAFESCFIKKTEWEAKKAGLADGCYKSWLVDTSIDERHFGGTIMCSSHVVESSGRFLRLSDTPGSDSYVVDMLRTLSTSDIVTVVIDNNSDLFKIDNYLEKLCKLLKIFAVDKLIFVLTNVLGKNCNDLQRKITEITKKYGKSNIDFIIIDELLKIQSMEISKIVQIIDQYKVEKKAKDEHEELKSPLILEIVDIHKPVDSVLPVVFGRVVSGGLSSGVNNPHSKTVIVPRNQNCTVKSMKVEEEGKFMTRSFAFAGDSVELTFVEITKEDSVKRGDIICHPNFPLFTSTTFTVKLMILTSSIDYVPIINGTTVFVWTRMKCSPATITKIISIEYPEGKKTIVKDSPTVIHDGTKIATVTLVSEDIIPVEYNSRHKLDVFLLFHNSILFAAGRINQNI